MLFISVKNNLRLRDVLKFSKEVFYERQRTIKTSDLNMSKTELENLWAAIELAQSIRGRESFN